MAGSKDNNTADTLVSQKANCNAVGVELFSYVNTFFCSKTFEWLLFTWKRSIKNFSVSYKENQRFTL